MHTLSTGAFALLIGAAFSAVAALAHLACIAIGPKAYRFMGAGERMAQAAEAKYLRPSLVTLSLAGVLFLWTVFALSGAGVLEQRLPLTKWALLGISTVYLARSVASPFLKAKFPENSTAFWLISSGICGCIGLLHAYGTWSLWPTL
ncbi:hypothetical protein M2375_004375 [Comamonas sp. BIGb0152]|uniref:hypothetical protein n=1 Tax=Comamonas sp. BIGb0152 TaxID=2940601 RepID=UPI0021687A4E|nr:hypothetical protein [Comamonas sp. BIGb0152]MCS4296122.1 hypothetical protein [Comamonas sp. BIGb0152]